MAINPKRKTKKSKEPTIGPFARRFCEYLEMGLDLMGEEFSNFQPHFVQHEDKGTGLLFSQLNPEVYGIEQATDYSVIAFEEGVSHPDGSLVGFSNEQTPEKVALLYMAALLKESPVNCPKCGTCLEHYNKMKE